MPLTGLMSLLPATSLRAGELYQSGDLELRWDNTVRYSGAARFLSRDSALIADPNADDGDRNFRPGIVSNRLDVESELDLTDGSFGVHASAAGWYDSIYRQRNDNDSPATFNPASVPNNKFTRAVATLHGEDAELLDAFVHGQFNIGDDDLTLRIGRQTLLWGESLFFADNGISFGQAPIDNIKELSSPVIYAREVFLPVAQASASLQISTDATVSAYYQFEWRKARQPGAGSYFSSLDYLDEGGERYIVAPNLFLLRTRDQKPPDSGQFGIALQFDASDFNYGFYVLRFNSNEPQVYLRPAATAVGTTAGSYNLVYPRGIELYGASFSGYLDDLNIAGELSVRRHMPLVSNPIAVPVGTPADGAGHPLYPVGDTFHAQLSSVETIAPNRFWDRADLAVEFALNDRLDIEKNAGAVDGVRTPFALAVRASFEPRYFEVLPGLDLGFPLGVGYGIVGNSSTDDTQYENAGDVEAGVQLTYRTEWSANLSVTDFFGSPVHQALRDRGFISFSVQRTF
jgi:hypothetical protein